MKILQYFIISLLIQFFSAASIQEEVHLIEQNLPDLKLKSHEFDSHNEDFEEVTGIFQKSLNKYIGDDGLVCGFNKNDVKYLDFPTFSIFSSQDNEDFNDDSFQDIISIDHEQLKYIIASKYDIFLGFQSKNTSTGYIHVVQFNSLERQFNQENIMLSFNEQLGILYIINKENKDLKYIDLSELMEYLDNQDFTGLIEQQQDGSEYKKFGYVLENRMNLQVQSFSGEISPIGNQCEKVVSYENYLILGCKSEGIDVYDLGRQSQSHIANLKKFESNDYITDLFLEKDTKRLYVLDKKQGVYYISLEGQMSIGELLLQPDLQSGSTNMMKFSKNYQIQTDLSYSFFWIVFDNNKVVEYLFDTEENLYFNNMQWEDIEFQVLDILILRDYVVLLTEHEILTRVHSVPSALVNGENRAEIEGFEKKQTEQYTLGKLVKSKITEDYQEKIQGSFEIVGLSSTFHQKSAKILEPQYECLQVTGDGTNPFSKINRFKLELYSKQCFNKRLGMLLDSDYTGVCKVTQDIEIKILDIVLTDDSKTVTIILGMVFALVLFGIIAVIIYYFQEYREQKNQLKKEVASLSRKNYQVMDDEDKKEYELE